MMRKIAVPKRNQNKTLRACTGQKWHQQTTSSSSTATAISWILTVSSSFLLRFKKYMQKDTNRKKNPWNRDIAGARAWTSWQESSFKRRRHAALVIHPNVNSQGRTCKHKQLHPETIPMVPKSHPQLGKRHRCHNINWELGIKSWKRRCLTSNLLIKASLAFEQILTPKSYLRSLWPPMTCKDEKCRVWEPTL